MPIRHRLDYWLGVDSVHSTNAQLVTKEPTRIITPYSGLTNLSPTRVCPYCGVIEAQCCCVVCVIRANDRLEDKRCNLSLTNCTLPAVIYAPSHWSTCSIVNRNMTTSPTSDLRLWTVVDTGHTSPRFSLVGVNIGYGPALVTHARDNIWCYRTSDSLVILKSVLFGPTGYVRFPISYDIMDMMIYCSFKINDTESIEIVAKCTDSRLLSFEIELTPTASTCNVKMFGGHLTSCAIEDSVVGVNHRGDMIVFPREYIVEDPYNLLDVNIDWTGCSVWGAGYCAKFRVMVCKGTEVVSVLVDQYEVVEVTKLQFEEEVVRVDHTPDVYVAFTRGGSVIVQGNKYDRGCESKSIYNKYEGYEYVFSMNGRHYVKWLCTRHDGTVDMVSYSACGCDSVVHTQNVFPNPGEFVMPKQQHTMNIID